MPSKEKMKTFPLLPLRDTVVFPGSVASLFVGRERSMEAMRRAMDANRLIALFTQKETKTVLPEKKDLYSTGVLAEILQLLKMPDGTFKVLVEGLHRITLSEMRELDEYAECDVLTYTTKNPLSGSREEALLERSVQELFAAFEEFNRDGKAVSEEFISELRENENSEEVVDAIAHLLPVAYTQRLDILETESLVERSEKVRVSLESQIEISELESSIHDRVRNQMDKMQKQYYLNEQIRVIREEMGEGAESEFDEYRRRIEEKMLPQEAKDKALSELRKLEKMPPMAAESTIVRNYLDTILELPWNETTEDNTSILKAQEILEDSHHSLPKVKDRLLEFIAVRQLRAESRGPILCLVGPPGVGKTSLARSIAKGLNREFIRISLGGVRDEAEIRGHRRTYIGALPGRILHSLKKAKVVNPVILLDEIDKLSSDYRGNPAAAMLEVLDPEQNKEFTDHYLELPYDLSRVLFIATANVAHAIPEALLDRLEVIQLSGYTEQEKIQIARKYLLPRQIENNGIEEVQAKYSLKTFAYIIRHYTREAGVRQLEREIEKICRKIAREYLEFKQGISQNSEFNLSDYQLDKKNIRRLLGPEQYQYNRKEDKPSVGKINGLAWTSAGGDILHIEVAIAHGKGNLVLTGNLGDVMKESAMTALGFIRSQAHLLRLPFDFFEKNDILLHVPEGAIPKDGPSAGIAIATAIISAVTQEPVHSHIAMTGEITLRGHVLPIGGLKEKSLAAFRGGVTDIVCPAENEKDMEEIPLSVREKLNFHFVRNIREVLPIALATRKSVLLESSEQFPFYTMHLRTDNEPIST